jgi:16S rRNA (uracil1498-N3)-methyltransferase
VSLRRFASPPLPAGGGRVRLEAGPSHHLLRVTGIAPGEAVELFDALGQAARAVLVGAQAGLAVLDVEPPVQPEAGPARWLLLGLLKGGAQDTAIRMATELGVGHVVPVLAERSVARGDRRDRWARVAAAAVAQCGRAAAPQLHAPMPLAAALTQLPADVRPVIALPGTALAPVPAGALAALVGPEGGWTDAEVAVAVDAGAVPLGLGGFVLRADTAVAAALARLG